MIDPIHVADLDSLFTEWLETYHCELLCLPNPVVVVDATLPGYLGLMEEMDILAEQFGTPILIRSYHEEEEESLPPGQMVLCVTRQTSLLSTLAQAQIYSSVQDAGLKPDLGQVWELSR